MPPSLSKTYDSPRRFNATASGSPLRDFYDLQNKVKEAIDKVPLEHYKLCIQNLFHSDIIKWTIFSIFAVLNGILISALITTKIDTIN